MKRTFRVAIILISVAVLLVGIGLWRNHYLKTVNSEPEKVYNNKPVQPKNLTTDANSPKGTHAQDDDNTDVTDGKPSKSTQRTDNSITSKEMDNTSDASTDTKFSDIAEENLTPEVVAAIKKYEEVQSELAVVTSELISTLRAEPLDMDAIDLIDKRRDRLKEQRLDALEILAKYSEEALNELQTAIGSRIAAESMITELEGSIPDEKSAAEKESAAKKKRMREEMMELLESIPNLSGEELEEALERINDLSEKLSKLE